MNEHIETADQSIDQRLVTKDEAPTAPHYPDASSDMLVNPQAGCASCGGTGTATALSPSGGDTPSYVYAIGRIETRFPNLAAEKEFARQSDDWIQPEKQINRLFAQCCPNPRTAISHANYAGF